MLRKITSRNLSASILGHAGLLDGYSIIRKYLVKSQVQIIMYHRVGSESPPWFPGAVSPENFEREISHLCKVARIVPLDWLIETIIKGKALPSKAACITFDDGYKDNYTIAYPILRKYNAPATIFLTTGYIGDSWPFYKARFAVWNTNVTKFEVSGLGCYCLKSPSDRLSAMYKIDVGLDKLPEIEKNIALEELIEVLRVDTPSTFGKELTLSWDEILDMNRNGISFGAHTVTHSTLTGLPIELARGEIINSKKKIEDRLGVPCNLFAYPNGGFNEEIIEILKENGFIGAFTTMPRMIRKEDNPLTLGRISAGPDFYTFKGSSSGLYPDLVKIIKLVTR